MFRLPWVRLLFFLLISIHTASSYGQTELTDTLPEVIVSESRLPIARVGRHSEEVDSVALVPFQGQSLGDVLLYSGQYQVRNNGIGLSTTTGMRGGSGTQTAVLWNGINIQNPTLGLVDLSLLHTGFMDRVQTEYGGSAALWGSGSVGGTIHLSNERPYGQGPSESIEASFGSFTRGHGGLRFSYGGKTFTSVTRVILRGGRNDFPYDSAGLAFTRTHARTRQWGILQSNSFRLAKSHEIGIHAWYQEGYREVPGTISFPSEATQDDQVLRLLADYRWSGSPVAVEARVGFTQDRIWYKLPAFLLSADNTGEQLIAEAEGIWAVGTGHELRLGLNNTWLRGRSDSYPDSTQQNRTALFAAWTWRSRNGKWNANLSARQEMVDGKTAPFVPSAALTAGLTDWLEARLAVSRNYRLPVLDDLYFTDAFSQSDPDLKPESGWSQELGLGLNPEMGGWLSLGFQTTLFNRNIENWIVWLPDTNFVYSPINVRRVWSRGLENELNLTARLGAFQTDLLIRYDWIRSTIEADSETSSDNIGNQLPYVPEHKVTGMLRFAFHGVSLAYRHNYTHGVFADEANVVRLNAFHLGRLTLAYTFDLGFGPIRLFGEADNLWNADYQLVNDYPQPGRMFRVGFALNLN